MASLEQVSLTRGEISPSAYERVDLQWWVTALKTCRNFITMPHGGAKNRPGTKFTAEVKDSNDAAVMLPFRYSSEQSYIVEVGDGYMRFHTNGSTVVYGTWTPWVTSTAYKSGDRRSNGTSNYRCAAGHTSGTFATDLAAGYWVLVGTIGAVVEIASPYASADLALLQTTQSADVMTIVHPNYMPQNLSRYDNDVWTVAPVAYTSGPWQEMNSDVAHTLYINRETGFGATITSSKTLFTSQHVGQLVYLEQRNYGTPWEPSKTITTGTLRRSDGKYYRAATAGTTGQLRPTHFVDTWSDGGVEWEYLHSGYGVARITAVGATGLTCTADILSRMPLYVVITSGGTTAVVNVYARPSNNQLVLACAAPHGYPSAGGVLHVDIRATMGGAVTWELRGDYAYEFVSTTELALPLDYAGFTVFDTITGTVAPISGVGAIAASSSRWRLGAWDGAQGFPRAVTYHQGRRVYASTPAQPQTVWASRVDSYEDFSTTSPIADDDALTFRLVSSQVNNIKGMLSMEQLLILTSGAEWVLGDSAGEPITPGNIRMRPQSFRGSADLQALGVNDVALFVQGKGQVVRDMSYTFADNRYNGNDITALSHHLFEGRSVVSWDYQQHPDSLVWLVMDDGLVVCLTYMRDQQVVGWHRHDFGGFVEDVACVSESDEDAVYFLIRRTVNGVSKRYIERLHTRLVTDVEESVFLDSALQFDGSIDPATNLPWAKTLTISSTGGSPTWDDQDFTLRVTASAPIFAFPGTTDIGDQLVWTEGVKRYRLSVTSVLSTTLAEVTVNREIPSDHRNTAFTGWAWARNVLSGLGHLEGETVGVLGDGFDMGTYTVASGAITLEMPAAKITVGLPYTCELETLSLKSNAVQETIENKKKQIVGVSLKVLESRGVRAGRDLDHLYTYADRTTEFYDAPTRLRDGLVSISFPTPWATDGSVVIQQSAPLPITVTSIMPEVEIGGV